MSKAKLNNQSEAYLHKFKMGLGSPSINSPVFPPRLPSPPPWPCYASLEPISRPWLCSEPSMQTRGGLQPGASPL